MKETDIQTELCSAANAADGFGYKAAHRFKRGVSDLFIQLPSFPGAFLEVKFVRAVPKSGIIPVALTIHQRNFMRKIQQAKQRAPERDGGPFYCEVLAGWVVIVGAGRGKYLIGFGYDRDCQRIGVADLTLQKSIGHPWPIREIVAGLNDYRRQT